MPITTPVLFKRGSTFAYILKMPDVIPRKLFLNWDVSCNLRRQNNTTPSGLIATISTKWIDENEVDFILIKHEDTDRWPLGLAEIDVMFTSPLGVKAHSYSIPFRITHGVTE